jgi:hypothetical protein
MGLRPCRGLTCAAYRRIVIFQLDGFEESAPAKYLADFTDEPLCTPPQRPCDAMGLHALV